MARPQEFDTSEALSSAMGVFWRKGYEATTLADILDATGLSKSSLYATFGDKRELFLAAFSTYRTARMQDMERTLNSALPARQSIELFFRQGVAKADDPAHAYGCMTANEAVELAPHDADIQQLIGETFQATEDAFAQAIERGQSDGSVRSCQDPRTLARFFVMCLQGVQVMVRARTDRACLDEVVGVMLSTLD